MRTFNVRINIDNAAFDEDPGPEIGRCLRWLAAEVDRQAYGADEDFILGFGAIILDQNGNTVGSAEVTSG